MTHDISKYDSFIGVDVAKATLMVHDSFDGSTLEIANTSKAMTVLLKRLVGRNCLIVCEATGGYEAELLTQALKAGLAIHRADARKVKSFIRSFGIHGKTDAIDARALAHYGRERGEFLPLFKPVGNQRQLLRRLVNRRRELVCLRVGEINRLKAPMEKEIAGELKASFKQLIRSLDKLIARLEEQIAALVAGCREIRQSMKAVLTIPGIGKIIGAELIALMPELGRLDRRTAASLAGVAPHPRQSGNSDGKRRIMGGRRQIRNVLFMAALTASKSKSPMGEFAKKLRENGKKPIVAITAVMRKIIIIANARIRDEWAKSQLS